MVKRQVRPTTSMGNITTLKVLHTLAGGTMDKSGTRTTTSMGSITILKDLHILAGIPVAKRITKPTASMGNKKLKNSGKLWSEKLPNQNNMLTATKRSATIQQLQKRKEEITKYTKNNTT